MSILSLIAATCAALAAVQSQTALPGGEPISLTFGWPVGLTATVESERTKTVVMDGKKKQTSGGLRYRMRVEAHPEGRLISYDSFEPLGPSAPSLNMQGLEEFVASMMPSLVVANDGEFIRVADLTKIRAAIEHFLATVKSNAPTAAPPGAQAILDGLASEEVLNKLASAEWQNVVGAFVGFTGRIGAPEDVDSEEPSPVIPDLLIPMRTTFGALKRVPCEAGGLPDSCVLMQVRSVIAADAMRVITKRLLDGVKDLEGLKYERFDITNELLSVMDPSTMRPYRILSTRSVEFNMSLPGRGTATGSQIEQYILRIRYHQ